MNRGLGIDTVSLIRAHGARRTARSAPLACRGATVTLAFAVFLGACSSSSTPPAPDTTATPPLQATATIAVPTATVEPSPTPAPTTAPEIEALLVPGPTFTLPDRIYFDVGNDIWQYAATGQTTRVTHNLDIGPYAPAPDAGRVAVVVHVADGDEVRLFDPSGTQSETITGAPSPLAITGLAWSHDGTSIAAAFEDGSIGALPVPGQPEASDPVTDEVPETLSGWTISEVTWAPTDAGLAYVVERDGQPRSLFIAPRGGAAFPIVDGTSALGQSVRTFSWLPGRGRIAYADDVFSNAVTPGSIFTVAPDGTARELLVSAGQFAPVAGVLDLSASPDGQRLAMTVFTPSAGGALDFHSLWLLAIDTGELSRVPVSIAYRVTDLWWTTGGLVWRGVERAPDDSQPSTYDGTEPFVLGLFDPATAQTTIAFQTALIEE